MLMSLALIFIAGFAASWLCRRARLPGLVGMLLAGVLLGPCVLDLLDGTLLSVSGQLRQMALAIILLKAGLTLNISDLKKVGRAAVLMSCLPAACEILGYVLLAPVFLGVSRVEAAIMGAVLAAVSPAVVVPRMVRLMEEKRGTGKSIPQLIMAGASCDDIFVIVLFSTFTGMAQNGSAELTGLLDIPISITLGVLLGAAIGFVLSLIFRRGGDIPGTVRTVLTLSAGLLLMGAESLLESYVPISGLLGVVAMACVLRLRSVRGEAETLAGSFGRLWTAAEVLLFVLVGAAVDIGSTLHAGPAALLMILAALVFRSAGVLISLLGTELCPRERLFCVLAYLPKATVQAAIGSVPLALGLSCGSVVLSVAVLGILITAPLGALAIDLSGPRLLHDDSEQSTK